MVLSLLGARSGPGLTRAECPSPPVAEQPGRIRRRSSRDIGDEYGRMSTDFDANSGPLASFGLRLARLASE